MRLQRDAVKHGAPEACRCAKKMNIRITVLILFTATQLCIASEEPRAGSTTNVNLPGSLLNQYHEVGTNLVPQLRIILASGSPVEKEEVLIVFGHFKVNSLIPDVVDAVADPTPLPWHDDYTYGFVGHAAASELARVAFTIDGKSLDQRGKRLFSYYGDGVSNPKRLQDSGRIQEVSQNWKSWWSEIKQNEKVAHP